MATQGGISYLVSELLEGETLRDRLRRGPIPLRKAIDYEVQVSQACLQRTIRGLFIAT